MMIKVMMMIKTHVKLHEHNHPEQKLTIMDPKPPWLKEGYQRNHGSCSEQFATSFATMMSTHCAHNAPPTSLQWGLWSGEVPASSARYSTIPAGNVFIRLTSVSAASAGCKKFRHCKFSFTVRRLVVPVHLWCSSGDAG